MTPENLAYIPKLHTNDLHPQPLIGIAAMSIGILGGPWDLVSTYNWDYNPTYNWGNPYKPI